ncbi:MAG: hypothetical protein IIA07_10405 [Proteobacteria bacterium]|nr:hypothetical protein [Pseudomonadota bacterium]
MNWEAIAAIGEIAGAIAVVATLFYLALQIRQNSFSLDRANEYAQAESVHHINALYVQVFSALSENAELASIYQRALDGAELDATESIRFAAFVNTFMAWLEDLHSQQGHELGFATESIDSLLETTGPYVRRLLETKAGSSWWYREAIHLYSSEFITAINAVMKSHREKSVDE